MIRLVLSLLCLLSIAPPVAAEDWPSWRGPRGDAISKNNDWQKSWSGKGPQIAWEKQIGTGYGSITVSDNRLFVMGHDGGKDFLYCFNPLDGKELWAQSYKADKMANMHEGGPGSTPLVTAGLVYTVSRQGHLHARDVATGTITWEKYYPRDFGVSPPEWGFTGSLISSGDKVYYDAGRTVACDAKSGKVIWQSKKFLPGYGTPALFSFKGKEYLAVLNNFGLVIFQSSDGKEVASYTWKTQYDTNATTPIISGDKIFISTAYNKGCALLKFEGNRLKPVYQNRDMRTHMNTAVLDDGVIYGFDRKAHNRRLIKLVSMDLETGKVNWRESDLGCGTLFKAGDTYLVMSDNGLLLSAQLTPSGFKELARKQLLEGQCWTMPMMAHNILYARNTVGRMVALDMRK